MKNQITTVLFDLGSTLIYFDADWQEVIPRAVAALHASLVRSGLELDGDQFVPELRAQLDEYYALREMDYTERTTQSLVAQYLRDLGFHQVPDEVIRPAVEAMYAVTQQHWQTEPDAYSTLENLARQGYRMAVLSNASDDRDVHTLVSNAGLKSFFELVLSSAAFGIRKPDPRIFRYVLDKMGVQPDETAMVGDTLTADILGAQLAGLHDIWITRRAAPRQDGENKQKVQPTHTIQALAELPQKLQSIGKPPLE
jgi:2-haloalkanoic acid dehalogenase type II